MPITAIRSTQRLQAGTSVQVLCNLFSVLCFESVQGIGVVEGSKLALSDGLLLHDRLLLVLRAFLHQRLVLLVLGCAVANHFILLGEALLALGFRCIELPDPSFAIVANGIWWRSGRRRNALVVGALFTMAGRGHCDDESDN